MGYLTILHSYTVFQYHFHLEEPDNSMNALSLLDCYLPNYTMYSLVSKLLLIMCFCVCLFHVCFLEGLCWKCLYH
jgi:hypothetical protein